MDRPLGPSVDEAALAVEIKACIDSEKINGVDYKSRVFQIFPDPQDAAMPEVSSISRQFAEVFNYADSVTGENGEDFPNDLIKEYEACLERVAGLVNSDTAFWAKVRAEVLPLYDRLRDNPHSTEKELALYEEWTQRRWRGIKLFYDPVGMEVKTTKLQRGVETNKIYSRELFRHSIIPEGLVIDLDGVGLSTIQRI